MEMLARSGFDRIDECDTLLSVLTSKDNQENAYAFYEWINPITFKREGAFPFRTDTALDIMLLSRMSVRISSFASKSLVHILPIMQHQANSCSCK